MSYVQYRALEVLSLLYIQLEIRRGESHTLSLSFSTIPPEHKPSKMKTPPATIHFYQAMTLIQTDGVHYSISVESFRSSIDRN